MDVSAMLPIILFPISGVMKLSETTASFGHKYVFLHIDGFILANTIEKWGFDISIFPEALITN